MVAKFAFTNRKHVPSDAIPTESHHVATYMARHAEATEEPIKDIMARECPGTEGGEHHQCQLGLRALEALSDRYLRTEVREIKKDGRVTKFAVMLFFASNADDMKQAVKMGQPSKDFLLSFAQKTFAGGRVWYNPGRVVLDFVSLMPDKPALEETDVQFTPSGPMIQWVPAQTPVMA